MSVKIYHYLEQSIKSGCLKINKIFGCVYFTDDIMDKMRNFHNSPVLYPWINKF